MQNLLTASPAVAIDRPIQVCLLMVTVCTQSDMRAHLAEISSNHDVTAEGKKEHMGARHGPGDLVLGQACSPVLGTVGGL